MVVYNDMVLLNLTPYVLLQLFIFSNAELAVCSICALVFPLITSVMSSANACICVPSGKFSSSRFVIKMFQMRGLNGDP